MKKLILSSILLVQSVFAGTYLDDNLKTLTWNDIEVVWLEDDSFPTYNLSVYFYAGALTDDKNRYGETEFMFNEMNSGTTRYSKKEISDALEFFGASYGANVTHEYSTYSVSGLVKDLVPTMKMVCHVFSKATFPEVEFRKTKRRALTGLKSIVSNHGALANRIFREVSLAGSEYNTPVSGTMKSIKAMTARGLHSKLKMFTNEVKKKIYIKGPKQVLNLENIIKQDCGWSGKTATKVVSAPKVESEVKVNNTIYFVPVPKANQAQIRLGRILRTDESNTDFTLKEFASRYIGGGFTSRLMQELRVKRGLTYSVGAYSSSQQKYGRAGINTFTKDPTLIQSFDVIKDTLKTESTKITDEHFNHAKKFLKGNYLFSLESSSAFLSNLLFFDHIGRSYSEIYQFSNEVDQISKEKLQAAIDDLYNWDKQTKLVLGNKNLIKDLKKAGYKVKILNYKNFL